MFFCVFCWIHRYMGELWQKKKETMAPTPPKRVGDCAQKKRSVTSICNSLHLRSEVDKSVTSAFLDKWSFDFEEVVAISFFYVGVYESLSRWVLLQLRNGYGLGFVCRHFLSPSMDVNMDRRCWIRVGLFFEVGMGFPLVVRCRRGSAGIVNGQFVEMSVHFKKIGRRPERNCILWDLESWNKARTLFLSTKSNPCQRATVFLQEVKLNARFGRRRSRCIFWRKKNCFFLLDFSRSLIYQVTYLRDLDFWSPTHRLSTVVGSVEFLEVLFLSLKYKLDNGFLTAFYEELQSARDIHKTKW